MFTTKNCCSKNLRVHKIRYDMTYICNSLWCQVWPNWQTTLCRGTIKFGDHFKSWSWQNTMIININHTYIYDGILLPLRGGGLEIPPLHLCGSFAWQALLKFPWDQYPHENWIGAELLSLPGDMAMWVGRSAAKAPFGSDPVHVSNYVKKSC